VNWLPAIIMGAGLLMCIIIFERRHTANYIKKLVDFLTTKDVEWD